MLNARHRQELLVQELHRGITVDTSRTDIARVSYEGKCMLTLDLTGYDAHFWHDQLRQVRDLKGRRGDRLAEIHVQQVDMMSFFGIALPLCWNRYPMLMALLDAVHEAVLRVEYPVKQHFSVARPIDLAPDINPIIQTPAHSAFPSGHATESFAHARIIGHLAFGGDVSTLLRIAERIAENRVVAGVHFPVDNLGGLLLGNAVADVLLHKLLGRALPIPKASTDGGPATIHEAMRTLYAASINGPVVGLPADAAPQTALLKMLINGVREELGESPAAAQQPFQGC